MRRLSEWRTSNERTKDVKSVQRDIREVTMEENISKYRKCGKHYQTSYSAKSISCSQVGEWRAVVVVLWNRLLCVS